MKICYGHIEIHKNIRNTLKDSSGDLDICCVVSGNLKKIGVWRDKIIQNKNYTKPERFKFFKKYLPSVK